jgi:hypothetical protein
MEPLAREFIAEIGSSPLNQHPTAARQLGMKKGAADERFLVHADHLRGFIRGAGGGVMKRAFHA